MSELAEVLKQIPDSPATLEFRAIALDPDSTAVKSGTGWVLTDGQNKLICAVGGVKVADVSQGRDCGLLADEPAFRELKQTFLFKRVQVLTLKDRKVPKTANAYVIKRLSSKDSLTHLSQDLRNEIQTALDGGFVLGAWVKDKPVGFAHTPWITETLADVSIDVLPDYRQRGIGRALVCKLVDSVVSQGLNPVWGAAEDNAASLALASSLGFSRPSGILYIAEKGR